MYKLLLIIISVAFINFNATSQTQDSTKTKYKHHVGLHASSVGGLGFSYRYWPNKLGVQATAMPVFRQNGGHFLSLGATGLYTLKEGKTVDLYSYLGVHYLSLKYSNSQSGDNFFNTGLGVGFKINLSEFLNLNIQTGYGFYNINESLFTSIAGGFGLYYSF